MGGKGAYQHLPNACTVLYGGTRAALHEFCGRDGRCVLLVPLAPLAHLAWALLRLLAFGRRRPYYHSTNSLLIAFGRLLWHGGEC